MEHTKHIIRAVLLLVVIAVVFVVVRHFAMPRTFGLYGHYRFESVAEYTSKDPVHGAVGACAECHNKEVETVSGGKHSSVSCEVCHAPLRDPETPHVTGNEKVADMPVRRHFNLCRMCHERLVSRPPSFPQVVLPDHVIENGEEMSKAVCLECHDAHNPSE